MKLLYTILLYGLIQLLPLTATNPVATPTTKEDLLKLYDNELQIMAKDFCEKAKNVSEILVEHKDLKEASTKELKDLETFLHSFLRDYPHIKRYNFQQPLLQVFINLATTDIEILKTKNREFDMKFQQIVKQYFTNILQDYERNYRKFINEKFLNKIENFQQQSSLKDLKEMPDLNKFINQLKTCQDYQCFPTNLDDLIVALNLNRELTRKYFNKEYNIVIFARCLLEYNLAKTLLKDAEFSQLSLELKQNLTNDIQVYLQTFENHTEIETFLQLAQEKLNYPRNYDFEKSNYFKTDVTPVKAIDFSSKDQKILKEIVEQYVANLDKSKFEFEFKAVVSASFLKIIIVAFLGKLLN